MCNLFSPILCDIYINYLKEILLSKYNLRCSFHYVGDLVDKNANISALISIINSINPCIQFTYEVECGNRIRFIPWF